MCELDPSVERVLRSVGEAGTALCDAFAASSRDENSAFAAAMRLLHDRSLPRVPSPPTHSASLCETELSGLMQRRSPVGTIRSAQRTDHLADEWVSHHMIAPPEVRTSGTSSIGSAKPRRISRRNGSANVTKQLVVARGCTRPSSRELSAHVVSRIRI